MKTISVFALIMVMLLASCEEEKPPVQDVTYHQYTIAGETLNSAVSGLGNPPIVFIPGLGDYGAGPTGTGTLAWPNIHKELQSLSTVFTYDPLGLGKSSGEVNAYDTHEKIEQLRKLLQQAGLHPPYVLLAHSLGGWMARLYAYDYPAEVAGLVLLDATSEYQDEANRAHLTGEDRELIDLFISLAKSNYKGYDEAIAELQAAGSLGNLPLAVVASDHTPCTDLPGFSQQGCDAWNAVHDSLQVVMKNVSSQLVFFDKPAGSPHRLYLEHPAVVRQAIQSVLEATHLNNL